MYSSMKFTYKQRKAIKDILEHLDWPSDDEIEIIIDEIQALL